MKKIIILILTFVISSTFVSAVDFYLDSNGVTVKCENASVGDIGDVGGTTYTKRSADQVSVTNAATSCTSGITDMSKLFLNDYTFNQPLNSWDVSSVTNMSEMFKNCYNFNQDLGDWNVSNVIDMNSIFWECEYFNQDISDWKVSKVTNMRYMFSQGDDFRGMNFNQDIGNWDVSNVTDMDHMFYGAENFNQNISGWDVSSVTDMSYMFGWGQSFNQPLNDWDVSSVTTMNSMFLIGQSFNQPLNNWNVSSVTSMSAMFQGAWVFNQNINNWDVSNVVGMAEMFSSARVFDQPLNDWDVSSVTTMTVMFYNAYDFNQPLNNWDVSSVRNMNTMFRRAYDFNQPLGDWDVSTAEWMNFMFKEASSFNQDLSAWCVSNIGSEPTEFSLSSPLIFTYKPVWGSCPYNGPPLPIYSEFDGDDTTDFPLTDVENVTNMTLEIDTGNSIQFPEDYGVNATGEDYDSNIIFGDCFVSVNSSALDITFNATAYLTMNNSDGHCGNNVIYGADGFYTLVDEIRAGDIVCTDCLAIAYSSGFLTKFSVSHFSSYAIGANSRLDLYDEYENSFVYINTSIIFYANYTNTTSGVPITGATCNVEFDDDVGTQYPMGYSGGVYTYTKASGFSTVATHSWNVTCNHANYNMLSVTDDIHVVNPNQVPEFSLLTLALAVMVIGIGLVRIRRFR